MNRQFIAFAALAVIGVADLPAARACGACIEDKVAATYDHAVVSANRQVVFVAVDGAIVAGRLTASIARAAQKVRGVRVATLRTSASPAAFSFALDARVDPAIAVAEFRKAIADPSLHLTLVRVTRDGELLEPAANVSEKPAPTRGS